MVPVFLLLPPLPSAFWACYPWVRPVVALTDIHRCTSKENSTMPCKGRASQQSTSQSVLSQADTTLALAFSQWVTVECHWAKRLHPNMTLADVRLLAKNSSLLALTSCEKYECMLYGITKTMAIFFDLEWRSVSATIRFLLRSLQMQKKKKLTVVLTPLTLSSIPTL